MGVPRPTYLRHISLSSVSKFKGLQFYQKNQPNTLLPRANKGAPGGVRLTSFLGAAGPVISNVPCQSTPGLTFAAATIAPATPLFVARLHVVDTRVATLADYGPHLPWFLSRTLRTPHRLPLPVVPSGGGIRPISRRALRMQGVRGSRRREHGSTGASGDR